MTVNMQSTVKKVSALIGLAVLTMTSVTTVFATSITYSIDPTHTYPSFEADHMGGLSVWRGKFNRSSGTVTIDQQAKQGSVAIKIDTSSIDFGLDALNDKAKSAEMFDVAQYPEAIYTGKFSSYKKGVPTKIVGELTLHGITKPLTLKLNTVKCMFNPVIQRDSCGADAITTFKRSDFGIDFGKQYGFNMDVTLRIQVEAVAPQK